MLVPTNSKRGSEGAAGLCFLVDGEWINKIQAGRGSGSWWRLGRGLESLC